MRQTKSIHYAAQYLSAEAVFWLLAQGADVNSKDSSGHAAIHYAAARENPDVILPIVARSACHIDLQDLDGSTALHIACANQSFEIIKSLVTTNASPLIRNDYGKTPGDLLPSPSDELVLRYIRGYELHWLEKETANPRISLPALGGPPI